MDLSIGELSQAGAVLLSVRWFLGHLRMHNHTLAAMSDGWQSESQQARADFRAESDANRVAFAEALRQLMERQERREAQILELLDRALPQKG